MFLSTPEKLEACHETKKIINKNKALLLLSPCLK
jgi:hypothetical protein